jgi:hypothetical protein
VTIVIGGLQWRNGNRVDSRHIVHYNFSYGTVECRGSFEAQ